MFEYIVELYLQEKKHYEKKPAHYTWTIDNFYKTIASSNKHSKSIPAIIASDYRYNELIHTTPEDNPTFWANFYMAWAIKSIQSNPKPSSSKKIDINFPRERPYFYSEKYCWTAFMILGMIVPDKQFDSSACASKYSKEEGGYLSRFSSESTYETVFKRNLCEDDISSFLECTSIEETELQRVSDEEATLLYKIVELNDDTTNSKQIKILLDNATFNYDSTKDGMTPITFNGNINYQEEENGYTALTLAAHKKKYRLVELLLNLGADPLIQNYNLELASDLVPFDSPLFTMLKGYELIYATFIGDLKKVTSILNEGADINFQGLGGYTALLIAIEQDFADLTELLLSSGADLTITCADGQGAFELVNSEGVYNILLNTIEIPEEEEEYPPEEDIEIPETKEKQISPPNKIIEIPEAKEKQISPPNKIIEIPEAKEKQISPPNKIIEIPEAKEKQISPPNKIIEIPEAKEKQVLPSKKNKKLVSENVVIENEENRAATPIQENPNSFFSSVNSVFSTVSTMFKGLKFY